MSGHKRATVTISQEEYRRLYDAENRNYYATLTIPDQVLNQTIQNSQDKLIGNFHEISERQNKYENVINQYQDKIRDIEVATTQSLYDQQVDFYNQLLGMTDLVWNNTSELIQIQSQEFEANVVAQNEHLYAQIQGLDQKMNWFNNREEKLYITSTNWLNDIGVLSNFIYSNYPRELVDEYMLKGLHDQIQLAHRNIEDGFYEASLSISQQIFHSLTHIRLELENQHALRTSLLQVIDDNISLIIERCSTCEQVTAIDLNGDELPEWIDVDYWTEHAISGLVSKLQYFWTQVKKTGIGMSVTELETILHNEIPGFSDQLAEIVNLARRSALNSQLRYNLAQMVMVAVINQGYQPKKGSFTEEDFRLGYLAKAVSADGSEIVVKVDPGEGFQNEIELINSNHGVINETEMRKRSIEIIQSLEAYGMNIGKIEQIAEVQKSEKPHYPAKIVKKVKETVNRRSTHG